MFICTVAVPHANNVPDKFVLPTLKLFVPEPT